MALFLKNLIFALVVPGTVAVYVPLWMARARFSSSGIAIILGWVLVGAGALLYVGSQRRFATEGQGTPAPIDAPKKLVISGPYRYLRNPMYLAVLTTILGWAVLFETLVLVAYAIAVAVCVELFVLFYEEPHLLREFGADYEAYVTKVGRWFPRRLF